MRRQEGFLKNTTVVEKQTRLVVGKGWREMLVLEGEELQSEGNYMVWVERRIKGVAGVELSGPIQFRMKEGETRPFSFLCSFVRSPFFFPSCFFSFC